MSGNWGWAWYHSYCIFIHECISHIIICIVGRLKRLCPVLGRLVRLYNTQPVLLFLFLISATYGESSCDHEISVVKSECTGCPPMFERKICASTTKYKQPNGKSSCGCPLHGDAAAGNAAMMMMEPDNPGNYWCQECCGLCFELCSTGGTTKWRLQKKQKTGQTWAFAWTSTDPSPCAKLGPCYMGWECFLAHLRLGE